MCFFSLFLCLSGFFFPPSIITCPRDWVTVAQSVGKGSLFDMCWVERREEQALIIASYFPLGPPMLTAPLVHPGPSLPPSLPPHTSSGLSTSTKACCCLPLPGRFFLSARLFFLFFFFSQSVLIKPESSCKLPPRLSHLSNLPSRE